MLEWLENWYESQCDQDWEHMFGIRIETLDNPGWNISIDLEDTGLDLKSKEWELIESSDDKWAGYSIKDYKFEGSCSSKNLSLLISVFKKLVEGVEVDSNEILSSLK